MSKGKLIVISGASGVGKGTVLGLMMKKRGDLTFSVSATTRPPRPGEVDGVHNYFVRRCRPSVAVAVWSNCSESIGVDRSKTCDGDVAVIWIGNRYLGMIAYKLDASSCLDLV